MSTYKKYFRTKDFHPDAPGGTRSPHKTTSTRFEVDEDSQSIVIQTDTRKETLHDDIHRTYWVSFELEDWSQLEDLQDFVKNHRKKGSGVTSEEQLSVVDGECYDGPNDRKESNISSVTVEANDDRITFYGGCGNVPVIRFSTEEIEHEGQDEDNLDELEDFLEDLCDDPDSIVLSDILTPDMRSELESIHYGSEVIQHIEDGDKCFENELFGPALGSYIHAIEWTMIAYLEDREGIDIIQKESNGVYYQFAAGQHNLLDELTDHMTLDQKTVSKIESMNQAERRWAAHHKSGKALPVEIRAVRSRLEELLTELFE